MGQPQHVRAARHGAIVDSRRPAAFDAAELPFEDGAFDLVLGHAVLHHLPALERSFAELHRVLAPGGTLFFAGEPSRHGDRIAAIPKRAGLRLGPAWRRAIGAQPAPGGDDSGGDDHALESQVDVHSFTPTDLEARAVAAGFTDVRVRRAFGEATIAFAALFALRAVVYTVLIVLGREGALAAAVVVLGWPAFLGVTWFAYRWYEGLDEAVRAAVDAAVARAGVAEPEPHWRLIRLAFASPARVAMVQMQDVLGLGSEARMNQPGRARGSWRWRMDGLPGAELGRRLREASAAAARVRPA